MASPEIASGSFGRFWFSVLGFQFPVGFACCCFACVCLVNIFTIFGIASSEQLHLICLLSKFQVPWPLRPSLLRK